MGVNLMGLAVCLAFAFTMLATTSLFGPWHPLAWLTVVVAIAVVLTHRLALLVVDITKTGGP